jgi:hypothetical protein
VDCASSQASLLALALVALLWGCASLDPRNPVPETLVTEARVPGMERARWWGDEAPADIAAEIRRTLPGITKLAESPPEMGRPVVNYLALSSGATMVLLPPVCWLAGHAQVSVHASNS